MAAEEEAEEQAAAMAAGRPFPKLAWASGAGAVVLLAEAGVRRTAVGGEGEGEGEGGWRTSH